jgi:hypothetical protein
MKEKVIVHRKPKIVSVATLDHDMRVLLVKCFLRYAYPIPGVRGYRGSHLFYTRVLVPSNCSCWNSLVGIIRPPTSPTSDLFVSWNLTEPGLPKPQDRVTTEFIHSISIEMMGTCHSLGKLGR